MENPTLPIGKPSRTIRGKLRNVDRAYLGGFFDGEGSLGLYFVRSRSKQTGEIRNDWKPSFFIRVAIGNTDPLVPKFLKDWYGGYLAEEKRNQRLPNAQNIWKWDASGKVAYQFLRDIVSYLYQKKERANLLIKYFQKKEILSFEEKNAIRNKILDMNGLSGKSHHPQRLTEKISIINYRPDLSIK